MDQRTVMAGAARHGLVGLSVVIPACTSTGRSCPRVSYQNSRHPGSVHFPSHERKPPAQTSSCRRHAGSRPAEFLVIGRPIRARQTLAAADSFLLTSRSKQFPISIAGAVRHPAVIGNCFQREVSRKLSAAANVWRARMGRTDHQELRSSAARVPPA